MSSLYVHIPFCQRKCFYCSFVVSIAQEQRMESYCHCLEKEMRQYKDESLDTVYIGGGTPTYLKENQIEYLLKAIHQNFQISSNCEITMEANPEGLTPLKLDIIKKYGVTRLSLGVQSLNNNFLKYLGRNHNSLKAYEAFKLLREHSFDNINCDLMFSFPQQTLEQLNEDLDAMMTLESDHISLYGLTIEERSRFFVKNTILPDSHLQAEFYTTILKRLEANGYQQYEISNFAKPGKESKHNLNYWHGGNYRGVGIGAHSHKDGKRFWNLSQLTQYIKCIEDGLPVVEEGEELAVHTQMMETILFGLRMNQGVDIKAIERRYDCSVDQNTTQQIESFIKEGFLVKSDERLQTTLKGKLVLDEISVRLIS